MVVNEFDRQVERLHRLTVWGRWLIALGCWAIVGSWSLWQLRDDLELLQQHFTWTAARYGLAYHLPAAFGLAFCVALTGSNLVWQSRNIIRGLPERERKRLEKRVKQIREKGEKHILWRWVVKKSG